MRHRYNSFDYWQNLINENKTNRGQMLMTSLPTSRSLYIHSLIFCKDSGLNNIWGYVPDEMALVGYIQYSFLQEAFYKWINSKGGIISDIPAMRVEEIILDGEKSNKITAQEANDMRKHLEMIKKCWNLPKNKIISEITKFVRDFNRTWYGDHREFLYLKIFKTPIELGEFVINSSYMTSSNSSFAERVGQTVEEWKLICEKTVSDKKSGELFREILIKHLTEII